MHTPPHSGPGHERDRRNPLRVYCDRCRHTEFVHCDIEDRRCLYSECACAEFRLQQAA